MTEMVRAQSEALRIIASFSRNQASQDLFQLPGEGAVPGCIEMMQVPKDMFDSILTDAMDNIAQQSGGKRDTQKELATALLDPDSPIPDKLVGSLMGYAGHWMDIQTAGNLCWAFRKRRISQGEPEMREYYQTKAYLDAERGYRRFLRKVDDIRDRIHRRHR